jgi:hypothetical protein
MTQQPCMGSGLLLPPLSEVTKSCTFVAVGDWPTGRATVSIDPDVPAIWQGKKWRQFGLRNIFIHARNVLLHAVNLRHGTDGFISPPKEVVLRIFINLYWSGSNPRTLGPVASTLTTSPPRSTISRTSI